MMKENRKKDPPMAQMVRRISPVQEPQIQKCDEGKKGRDLSPTDSGT